jgi:hypothetical protein
MNLRIFFHNKTNKITPFHTKQVWNPPERENISLLNLYKKTRYEITKMSRTKAKNNLSIQRWKRLKPCNPKKTSWLNQQIKGGQS